jgi:hypothetical protein
MIGAVADKRKRSRTSVLPPLWNVGGCLDGRSWRFCFAMERQEQAGGDSWAPRGPSGSLWDTRR